MDKILVVDDADVNRIILKEIFKEQYEVLEAADGQEACDIIDEFKEEINIIFLDILMPKKTGLEVLAHMRHRDMLERIPVIVITGESSVESDTKAYEYGAADIIYKPFAPKVVMRRSQNLIELYQSKKNVEIELSKRTEELKKNQEMLANTNEFLLDALGSVVEFRSLESGEHVQRVKKVTKIILKHIQSFYPEYKLTNEDITMMSQAAALHDVGKIAIKDDILKAPRTLTPEEFAEMKKHTILGCDILDKFKMQDNKFFKYCYEICRWHHEKVDGNGYPDGLVGNQIPIYCQAVSIADCFDALCSKRVYKGPVLPVEAFNMIKRGECGAFSDVILDAFDAAKFDLFYAYENHGMGVIENVPKEETFAELVKREAKEVFEEEANK